MENVKDPYGWLCLKCGASVSPNEKVCPICSIVCYVSTENTTSDELNKAIQKCRTDGVLISPVMSDSNKKILKTAKNEK